MRNLDFTDGSPQSIKLGDSNDVLSLKVTESDQPVDLSKASSITVKIGNTLGYLTEINVDVASLLHPTDGIIDVVVSSKISSELPAGQYLIEVWIDDAQGNTVIYPGTSYPTAIGFSIEKNIMTATSTVITTLTLADFKTKFDEMQEDLQYKAASGYFKGDTGTVDNAGLISAPAFQSLQTQVDNSAVGINLLMNTGDLSANWTLGQGVTVDTSRKPAVLHYPNTTLTTQNAISTIANQQLNDGLLQPSTTYTTSFYAKGIGTIALYCYPNVSNIGGQDTQTYIELTGDYKLYTITFTTVPNIAGNKAFLIRQEYSPSAIDKNTVEAYFYGLKLEKGSKATDWCPNPAEILTKSDNSAVGTNLLINTSSSATSGQTAMLGAFPILLGVYSRTDSYEQVTAPSSGEFLYRFMNPNTNSLYNLTPGETYTLSGSVSHTTGELKFRLGYVTDGINWSDNNISDLGIPISDGSVLTPFSHTFAIPVGAVGVYFGLQNYDYTAGGLFRFKNMKLEKGSVATDWCPNPAEILTQSDYAKIKAAIVALGGSLS